MLLARNSIRSRIWELAAVAVLSVAGLCGLMLWSYRSAVEAEGLVKHSEHVLYDLWLLDRGNLAATASVRGFYLGHHIESLKDYDDFVGQHDAVIDDLHKLTADNLQQQTLIGRIGDLIDLRISKTKQLIDLGRAGEFDQALKLGAENQLGPVVNELRDAIDQSVAVER